MTQEELETARVRPECHKTAQVSSNLLKVLNLEKVGKVISASHSRCPLGFEAPAKPGKHESERALPSENEVSPPCTGEGWPLAES